MKTTLIGFAAAALLAAGTAEAQGFETYRPRQSLYIVNYEISFPIGDFHDKFIDETSFRGFSFEGRSMVNERLSVGLGFNFNRFEQTHHNLAIPTSSGGLFTGPVYRYADQLAMKGLLHLYLLDPSMMIRPYVGVGLGGVWSYAFSQTADLTRAHDSFSFIASPEVGVTVTAAHGASSIGLNVAARYNYTTADFLGVNDAQTFAVVMGIFGAY